MSMKTKLSPKSKLAQKVLICTINEFLDRGMFELKPDGNGWGDNPIIEFHIDDVPAIASVHDAGHGELSIRVALWPTDHGVKYIKTATMSSSMRRAMGGFYAHAWLERKNGAWLQTSGGLKTVSCAKDKVVDVGALEWQEPKGFLAEGKFCF